MRSGRSASTWLLPLWDWLLPVYWQLPLMVWPLRPVKLAVAPTALP